MTGNSESIVDRNGKFLENLLKDIAYNPENVVRKRTCRNAIFRNDMKPSGNITLAEIFGKSSHASPMCAALASTDRANDGAGAITGERAGASCKPRELVTVDLDRDVLATFRATGRGWQGRLNAALREWLGPPWAE